MELGSTCLNLLGRKYSVHHKRQVRNPHISFLDMILEVSRELPGIYEICQPRPKLWIRDSARLQLESEVGVDCNE